MLVKLQFSPTPYFGSNHLSTNKTRYRTSKLNPNLSYGDILPPKKKKMKNKLYFKFKEYSLNKD